MISASRSADAFPHQYVRERARPGCGMALVRCGFATMFVIRIYIHDERSGVCKWVW